MGEEEKQTILHQGQDRDSKPAQLSWPFYVRVE